MFLPSVQKISGDYKKNEATIKKQDGLGDFHKVFDQIKTASAEFKPKVNTKKVENKIIAKEQDYPLKQKSIAKTEEKPSTMKKEKIESKESKEIEETETDKKEYNVEEILILLASQTGLTVEEVKPMVSDAIGDLPTISLEKLKEILGTISEETNLINNEDIKNMLSQLNSTKMNTKDPMEVLVENPFNQIMKEDGVDLVRKLDLEKENFSKENPKVSSSEEVEVHSEENLENQETIEIFTQDINVENKEIGLESESKIEENPLVLLLKDNSETSYDKALGKQDLIGIYNNYSQNLKQEIHNVASVAKTNPLFQNNYKEVSQQIVEKIEITTLNQHSEIKMKLSPESLGNISLKIEMERGILSAKFFAESQQVKEIIENNFTLLKDVLEKQGLQIQHLSVTVGNEDKEHQRQLLQQKGNSKKTDKKVNMEDLEEIYGEEYEKSQVRNPYLKGDNNVDYIA